MIQFNSPFVRRASLLLATISAASCGSVANYVVTGHWEDPNAEEVSAGPTNVEVHPASTVEKKAKSAEAAPELALLAFPAETSFTYGIWTLYRNERGMFFWTGKGDTLRLFAIELSKDDACWTTRKADGPRVMHCLDKHYALLRDLKPEPADQKESPSAARDALNGLPNPPWRNAALTASNLAEGNYDLPDRSGGKKGTFSLEATPTNIKIQLPPLMGERWFVLSNDKPDVLFAGDLVQLFDGCTNADKTLAVYKGMAIQLDKKTCGIEVDSSDFLVNVKVNDLSLRFRIVDAAPNLAAKQEDIRKLRQNAVETSTPVELSVTGDAKYTLVTARGKSRKGEMFGLVESDRTIGNRHYQCIAQLEGSAVEMLPRAKQICLSMRAP